MANHFTGTYAQYLTTSVWHYRRNEALKRASYTCQRCGVKRQLQVHHLSYERLGNERDEDLEVLCKGCHLGHHAARAQEKITLYIKLAREVLRAQPLAGLADLTEYVKRKCAELHIGYDTRIVNAALKTIGAGSAGPVAEHVQEWLETAPEGSTFTRAEAAAIVSRLRAAGLPAGFKHIPEVKPVEQIDIDKAKALQIAAQEIADSIERCEQLEREAAEIDARITQEEAEDEARQKQRVVAYGLGKSLPDLPDGPPS